MEMTNMSFLNIQRVGDSGGSTQVIINGYLKMSMNAFIEIGLSPRLTSSFDNIVLMRFNLPPLIVQGCTAYILPRVYLQYAPFMSQRSLSVACYLVSSQTPSYALVLQQTAVQIRTPADSDYRSIDKTLAWAVGGSSVGLFILAMLIACVQVGRASIKAKQKPDQSPLRPAVPLVKEFEPVSRPVQTQPVQAVFYPPVPQSPPYPSQSPPIAMFHIPQSPTSPQWHQPPVPQVPLYGTPAVSPTQATVAALQLPLRSAMTPPVPPQSIVSSNLNNNYTASAQPPIVQLKPVSI
jgi:hypothetical protein